MLNAMYDSTFGQPEHSSLYARCHDRFGSGICTGNRHMEFCQDSSKTRVLLDIFGDTKAFCLGDVSWQLTSGMRLTGAECLAHPRSKSMVTFVCSPNRTPLSTAGSNSCTALSSVLWPFRDPRMSHHRSGSIVTLLELSTCLQRLMWNSLCQKSQPKCTTNPNTPAGKTALQKWSCHSLCVEAWVLM